MRLRNLYGLMVITAVAWLLILGESYFFIAVVRPLGPPLHVADLPSTVLKLVLTAGLGLLWVGVMFVMGSLYARFTRTPTSVS
jgi:hypothetical protein